jgi:SAM-dependent methyltransferase
MASAGDEIIRFMNKLFKLVKWGITLGSGSQNFLGADWIQRVLARTPERKRRSRALGIISLSPHYFINGENPAYAGMTNAEYRETSFAICRESRERIRDEILAEYINATDVFLDYGCGPGFLATALAAKVNHVYAADISPGAIACARILNPAENLDYIIADEAGLSAIADESVDAVVSFAVVQHLTADVYDLILGNCRRKLRRGGRLILHIQLPEEGWKTEEQWRTDRSITGILKFRYGLHCFARTAESHLQLAAKHGFVNAKIESITDIVTEKFDDVCSQHLLTATKPV